MKTILLIATAAILISGCANMSTTINNPDTGKEGVMSKSKYAKQVDATKNTLRTHERMVLDLSSKLKIAMGLNSSQLDTAIRNSMSWPIGEYQVVAQRRRLCGRWHDVLEIWPIKPEPHLGDGWIYHPKGTCTTILPPDEIISEIMKSI